MSKPQNLAALRDRITALKAKRQAVADAPRARSESRRDIDDRCKAWAQEGAARIGYNAGMAAHGSRIDDLFLVQPSVSGMVDLGPVLAYVLTPERLAATLAVHLERFADGPTVAERAAQIAEIERELFDAECAEERHIESVEATGLSIARRGDADPRAVLGLPGGAASSPTSPDEESDVGIRSTPHVAQAARVAKSNYMARREG